MEKASTIKEKWMLCAFFSFITFVLLTLYLSEKAPPTAFRNVKKNIITLKTHSINELLPINNTKSDCNVFEGKWVYKPMESPFYKEDWCPFLSNQVSCRRNGRADSDYRGWIWEANECDIPRFDKEMLERMRGKRVIIVGDSLNRNQWESLACLFYSLISPSTAFVDVGSGFYKVFKAKDYNFSVEYYWSPFLVQLETNQENGNKTLKLDEISPDAKQWKGADIMVFNSGHWWIQTGPFRTWDLFQYQGKTIKDMEIAQAFGIAMKTWAQWVDQNVDSNKTKVFFRSISPEHKGVDSCVNVTKHYVNETYKQKFPKPMIEVVERTIKGMRTPVKYLNITKLSEYRIDGHPGINHWKNKQVLEKQTEPKVDCSHWCLPGIPDTWNRLLYALLVFDTSSSRNIATTSDATI